MARKSELEKIAVSIIGDFDNKDLLNAIGNIGIIFGPPLTLTGIIAKVLGGKR